MKDTELMIGDYVNVTHIITNVTNIAKIKYSDLYYMQGEYNQKLYNPIPITDEFLKINGFTNKQLYWVYKLDDNHELEYNFIEHKLYQWEYKSVLKEAIFICTVTYVHELQHAFKMCGIDKEVRLNT